MPIFDVYEVVMYTSWFYHKKNKNEPHRSVFFLLAEKEGFEPSHTVKCLRAFQARPFSLLGISPVP